MIVIYTSRENPREDAFETLPDDDYLVVESIIDKWPDSIFFFAELAPEGWSEPEYHDEDTLMRVAEAIRSANIVSLNQIHIVITAMQNAGILFRERR